MEDYVPFLTTHFLFDSFIAVTPGAMARCWRSRLWLQIMKTPAISGRSNQLPAPQGAALQP
jgi:hypothetical protein